MAALDAEALLAFPEPRTQEIVPGFIACYDDMVALSHGQIAGVIGPGDSLISDRPGFTVAFAGRTSLPGGQAAADTYRVYMIHRGHRRLGSGDGVEIVAPGDVCTVRPGVAHGLMPATSGEAALFLVSPTTDPAGRHAPKTDDSVPRRLADLRLAQGKSWLMSGGACRDAAGIWGIEVRFRNSRSAIVRAARRTIRLVAATIFAAGLVSDANAAPRLVSLMYNSALRSPQQIGADAFHDAMVAGMPGRVAVDERASTIVGAESSILAGISAGTVNVAVLSASVVGSVVPDLGVFDIPFLFRSAAHAKAVADGPVGAAIAAKCLDKGMILLAIGQQGFRNITNSKHPIRSPADLAGLKIRLTPNEVYRLTFKTLGAEVVPMEFPLVYAALMDGRIDGQENPISTIASNRLQDVQKYLSVTGHFFSPIVFIANRDFFQALPPAEQAALQAAARSGADATWQAGADADAKGLDELRKGGMEVLTTVDRQAFVDAVKPLEAEFETRFGKETLAIIRATR